MKKYTRKLKVKLKKRGGGTKKKCGEFCKNEFLPKRRLIYQKIASDKNEAYVEYTPKEYKFALNACKKVYCNKGCRNKYRDSGFYENVKDDFNTDYTKAERDKLQEKGALTGCYMKDKRYVDNYL